jgi:hypothetical protein
LDGRFGEIRIVTALAGRFGEIRIVTALANLKKEIQDSSATYIRVSKGQNTKLRRNFLNHFFKLKLNMSVLPVPIPVAIKLPKVITV